MQYLTDYVEFEELGGAYTLEPAPVLSTTTWWKGEFQPKADRHFTDHIGFRSLFIRSYNQFNYSAFGVTHAPGCVIGEDGQLYLESYINDYTGANFLGAEHWAWELDKLKYMSDFLAAENVALLTVFAPGKASFEPEGIPKVYTKDGIRESNHRHLISAYAEAGLDFIDLNSYFQSIKGESSYPLYPKNGVHWTQYGAYLGMDSIITYVEHELGRDIPDMHLDTVRMVADPIHPDNDVEVNMNLFWPIGQPALPHIQLSFDENERDERLRFMAVSDSYYWPIEALGIPQSLFADPQFWFYFKTAQPQAQPIDELEIRQEILEQDVIVLMGTEATTHLFPYGFTDKGYELFMPCDSVSLMEYYSQKINTSPDWRAQMVEKAAQEGRTIEYQVELDAKYMADLKRESLSPHELSLAIKYDSIRGNPGVWKSLGLDAERSGIHPLVLMQQMLSRREWP